MKILPVELIRKADEYTIQHEPISDIDLMERASGLCADWISENIPKDNNINVFAGNGNNGGDGLAIARMLSDKGFAVSVFVIWIGENLSPSCKINYDRFKEKNKGAITDVYENNTLPEIPGNTILIDAIFGSGLGRPAKGFPGRIIEHMNSSAAPVIAIDVPSGLFIDKSNTEEKGAVVNAWHTLTFLPPKLAFYYPENDKSLGSWTQLNIGLLNAFIDKQEVKNHTIDPETCKQIKKERNRYDHKGHFGHALLVSGSYGKMGACVLGAAAALRTGLGLLSCHIPRCGYSILQSSIPEAMVSIDDNEQVFSTIINPEEYNAIAIGPGLGLHKKSQSALKVLIQEAKQPVIFDADAINILSENKTWIPFIPRHSIFTPHPKEFERLVGKSRNNFHRSQLQREFSFKTNSYVVLKGAHTSISTPEGIIYFNQSGNPGMATAGSGDVLTGIILSLMAQSYTSLESCILGVYIHGLAGDISLETESFESLIAGDIIKNLGKAFKSLEND